MVNVYYQCDQIAGNLIHRVAMPLSELKSLCIDHNLPLFRISIRITKITGEPEKELKKPYIRHFTIYQGSMFYNHRYTKRKEIKDPKKTIEIEVETRYPQSEDKEPRELEPNIDDAEWRV